MSAQPSCVRRSRACSRPARISSATASAACAFWRAVLGRPLSRGAPAPARGHRRRPVAARPHRRRSRRSCSPTAPADVRFHISRGAVRASVNTVPLLHPRGYLQVQDIFVATMDEYRQDSGARQAGRLRGELGQRRPAARRRRANRLRRATSRPFAIERDRARAFSTRHFASEADHGSSIPSHRRRRQLLDARLAGAREERLSPAADHRATTSTRCTMRRSKAAIKDQEIAGRRRRLRRRAPPRQHDRLLRDAAHPACEIDRGSKASYYDFYESVVRNRMPMAPLGLVERLPLSPPIHRPADEGFGHRAAFAGQADPQPVLPDAKRRSRSRSRAS